MAQKSMINLTEGSILGKLIPYSLPIIAGNMLQQFYNVTDTLIVGQTLGVMKLAAVGATGSLNFLMLGFIMGITSGCAVISSQAYGSGDQRLLCRSIAAHMAIAAALTVLMTVSFLLAVNPLLRLMNTTQDIFAPASAYITAVYQGIVATMLYNFLSATLRAVGDSRTPLLFLLFSSILNIALDLIFILTFGWDVQGAAWATVLAQLLSGILCYFYVRKKIPELMPQKDDWRGLMPLISHELRVGVPMGFQFTLIALGMMVLQSVLNGFGAEAVAAFTVGGKMHELMQNPLAAMSVVMATYAGQNLGAQKYDRISAGVRQCAIFTFLLSCAIGGIVFIFRDWITGLFIAGHDPKVMYYAHWFMNWECPSITTLSLLFVYRGAIQGLGDGLTVMLGGLFELAMRTVIPICLGGIIGYTSVCCAGPAAWTSSAVLMIAVFYWHLRKLHAAKAGA